MATVSREEKLIRIETNCYQATIQTEDYVSGISAGSFIDKRTGVSDLSFGLCIADFLLEPGIDDEETSAATSVVGVPSSLSLCARANAAATAMVDGLFVFQSELAATREA